MSTVATFDAILAALVGAGVNAYEPNGAPESVDPPRALLYMDLGRGVTYRLSGRTKTHAHRCVVIVAGTTPNNVRVIAGDVTDALEGVRIGKVLLSLESSTRPALDDIDVPNVYSATLGFTFAASPTA